MWTWYAHYDGPKLTFICPWCIWPRQLRNTWMRYMHRIIIICPVKELKLRAPSLFPQQEESQHPTLPPCACATAENGVCDRTRQAELQAAVFEDDGGGAVSESDRWLMKLWNARCLRLFDRPLLLLFSLLPVSVTAPSRFLSASPSLHFPAQ